MAGRIPQEFIDHLLARVDLVELIEARVPLRKAGREYVACCPFHNEKTPSFTVSPAKQFYHCFGCGAHGNAIGFLLEYEHMEFVEAVEELAAGVGLSVPREGGAAPSQARQPDLYGVLERAAGVFREALQRHPAAARARDYLAGRGLDAQVIEDYAVGYAPPGWDHLLRAVGTDEDARRKLLAAGLAVAKSGGGAYDRFRDRIMFPIRDRRGRTIAFGGRILEQGSPKYLNSPETPLFHKGRELYGLFEAQRALRRLPRLLVVEGYMDVIALAQHGIRYAVATLGTATTGEHVERMFRATPELVFCFDGDRAGRQAAWRALESSLPALRGGRQVGFLFLPEGEDPDTLVRREGGEAFERRIAQCVPLSRFLYEELGRQADTRSMDGRARLVELARPLLARVPEGVFRDLLIEGLAERAQVDLDRARRWLEDGRAPTRTGSPRQGPRMVRPRTPVRWAVSLLLHRPGLAAEAGDPARLRALDRPGMPLLVQLLELLQQHPHLNTAALLERWRGTEEGHHLARLAAMPMEIEGADLAQELRDTLASLEAKHGARERERRLAELSRKPLSEWSEEERREMRQRYSQDAPQGEGEG